MNTACAGKFARFAHSPAAMVALSLALAASARAAAQSRPQSMLADAAPSISESQPANQVTLNLLVHGKKNKPVPDLKPADISLADAGQPVSSGELRLSPGAESGDRLVTFLFDRLDAGSADRAAKAARKILKNLSGRNLEIAVLAVDRRLRILQPFTSDTALVGNAIGQTAGRRTGMDAAATAQEKAMAAPPPIAAPDSKPAPAPKSAPDNLASLVSQRLWNESSFDAARRAEQIASEQHTPPGMASLVATACSQRRLPGRKVIVYFTQDTPADLEAADNSHAAAEVLRDASVSAFIVDMNIQDAGTAEGMEAAMAVVGAPHPAISAPGTPSLTPPGMAGQISNTVNEIEFGGLNVTKTPLGQLAENTGGLYSTSDVNTRKVSRQILDDLTDYYTVTYPTSTSRLDGNFHTVSVKAVRSGLKMKTQPGYFASPKGSDPEADPGDSTLLQALEGSQAASDLTLRTALLRFGASPTGLKEVIAVEVPIRQLDLRVDANTNLYSIHAIVAGEIKDQTGAPIARFHQEIRRHGAADSVARVLPQVLSIQRTISLAPGDYQLETVVQDQNSGKIGRSTQTIHLAETPGDAVMSDLVLVRARNPDGDGPNTSPLRYRDEQVVPNLSGAVPGGARTASLYFQLYPQKSAAQKSAPDKQELSLQVSRDGKPVGSFPLKTGTARPGQSEALFATVNLGSSGGSDQSGGHYRIDLLLNRDGHVTRRQLDLTRNPADSDADADSDANADANADADAQADAGADGIVSVSGPSDLGPDAAPAAVKPLAPAESAALLAGATRQAITYGEKLPNFLCVETIDRSIDGSGRGAWKHLDSISELLRYRDRAETRTILRVDGKRSSLQPEDITGARSIGEFGGILQIVFDPAAAADFKWARSETQSGSTLQVFSYTVDAAHSDFILMDTGSQLKAAFHGFVYIDADTRTVRRIVAQTDNMKSTNIHASWMEVYYDYFAINGHDYLLPARGEVGLRQGRRAVIENKLRFTDYRRFGSRTRILGMSPVAAAATP